MDAEEELVDAIEEAMERKSIKEAEMPFVDWSWLLFLSLALSLEGRSNPLQSVHPKTNNYPFPSPRSSRGARGKEKGRTRDEGFPSRAPRPPFPPSLVILPANALPAPFVNIVPYHFHYPYSLPSSVAFFALYIVAPLPFHTSFTPCTCAPRISRLFHRTTSTCPPLLPTAINPGNRNQRAS